jgi:putative DNA primase/helicase
VADDFLIEDEPWPFPSEPLESPEPEDNDSGNGQHEDEVTIDGYVLDRLREPGLAEFLSRLTLTDAGNAEGFVKMYGNRFRFDHLRGRGGDWLRWNGSRWEIDCLGQAQRAAVSLAKARRTVTQLITDDSVRKASYIWSRASAQRSGISAMLWMSSYLPPFTSNTNYFDLDPWLLSCGNGTLDLQAGKLRKPNPADMITKGSRIEYHEDAKAPRWDRFLKEIFNNDEDLIGFIRRSVGYSLTGDCREQCLFLCWGHGWNGKGVLFNTLRSMMGSLAADTAFTTFEVTRSESSNDLAAIAGSRLVTASETSETKRLNEGRIKAITGRDPVTCRFLYNEHFTYTPMYKIWLAMNHKPEIRGTDKGIWRRIRLIPFTVSFEEKADFTVEEKLRAELPGILAWAVRGCLEWQNGGLRPPKVVLEATEQFRHESDLVGRFLEEKTQTLPLGSIGATALYGAFISWCKANGEETISNTAFGRRMTERGMPKNTNPTVRYLGLAFRMDEEESALL